MFEVKICGLTTTANALEVADSLLRTWNLNHGGAHERQGAPNGKANSPAAIGLNFYPNSKRFVDSATAMEISQSLPRETHRVGVFVNASLAQIEATADQVELDWVQLHGDESLEFVAQVSRLPNCKVIRAVRWSDQSIDELRRWEGAGSSALLVDAYAPNEYGGTGERVDWHAAAELRRQLAIPLVLAGGLRADNVAEAIRTVQPAAVDTASGVESAAGVKSVEQVEQFARAARDAYRASR